MKKKIIFLSLSLGLFFGAMAQTTPVKSDAKSRKQVEVPVKKQEKAATEAKKETTPATGNEKKSGTHRHHAKQAKHKK